MRKLGLLVGCLMLAGCGGHSLMFRKTCDQKLNNMAVQAEEAMFTLHESWAVVACNGMAMQQVNCINNKGKIKFNLAEACDQYLSTTTVHLLIKSKLVIGVQEE